MSNLLRLLPVFENYSEYSSSNYGAHTLKLTFGGMLTLWYSYDTIVAFWSPNTGKVVHQNDWGTTTGKHLNWIDYGDKRSRVNDTEFKTKLNQALSTVFASQEDK